LEGDLGWVHQLMQDYGLWTVFILIFLESSGVPLPGETALITAAVYAGSTSGFALWQVIAVASAAAILGDSMGYLVGRKLGLPLLERWALKYPAVEKRVRVGEYMFVRHGGKIVFFGRFVALLRILAAVLAGANKMPWPRFFVMNALGGICWASLFATIAYVFGSLAADSNGPIGYALLGISIVGLVVVFILFRRYEHRLLEQALKETEQAKKEGHPLTGIVPEQA
jgi:membrane protein DedA with SNARE-associated domain